MEEGIRNKKEIENGRRGKGGKEKGARKQERKETESNRDIK